MSFTFICQRCHATIPGDVIQTRKLIRWLVLSNCVNSARFVPICLLSQQPYVISMSITKCVQSVCKADYACSAERVGKANCEWVLGLCGLCCMQRSEASSATSAGIYISLFSPFYYAALCEMAWHILVELLAQVANAKQANWTPLYLLTFFSRCKT